MWGRPARVDCSRLKSVFQIPFQVPFQLGNVLFQTNLKHGYKQMNSKLQCKSYYSEIEISEEGLFLPPMSLIV